MLVCDAVVQGPEENKAKLSMAFLERLSPIYERYEPRLFSRMLTLLDALKKP